MEGDKAHQQEGEPEPSMPSPQEEEEAIKKKYGGIVPKKPPLISKDHERAYFDSADWALGKPTQQQTRYRKSPYAPADGEDGSNASEDASAND